jgi:hypothetical protein
MQIQECKQFLFSFNFDKDLSPAATGTGVVKNSLRLGKES